MLGRKQLVKWRCLCVKLRAASGQVAEMIIQVNEEAIVVEQKLVHVVREVDPRVSVSKTRVRAKQVAGRRRREHALS